MCRIRAGLHPLAAAPGRFPEVTDEEAMAIALEEAATAAAAGDVPVGAVVLDADGAVLARRHNERELLGDPTAHAEVLALRDAAAATGSWRLGGATVVATLEPCPMCAGALVGARVRRLVFGAADPKAGACGSLYNLCADPRLNHEVEVVAGVEAAACAGVLSAFFRSRRLR
jgi:tRNA(adenine34) deaminase